MTMPHSHPGTCPGSQACHSSGLGLAPPLWVPLSIDVDCDAFADQEDAGPLWPTFVALFLLSLFYGGFVTFVKVKVRDPAPLGCAKTMPFQGARWSRPGTVQSWETPAGGQWAVGTRLA
ncbi:Ig delta chain C region membrane-bound form [Myotis davidii]|uniref:Ig delta chain C region membrane-bound form n=1 Tax=Myotis davidii TaxID=225400 RepID=L5MDB3_MYODS|nr:Ig delta chain C region membrane-bound form [Myotis davidii]